MEGFPYLTSTLIDHQILMPLLNFGICIICMICTSKLCTKSINHYWKRRFRTILPDDWRGRTINVYFHFTPQVNTIVQTSLKVFILKQESFLEIEFNMCCTYGTHFQSWTFCIPLPSVYEKFLHILILPEAMICYCTAPIWRRGRKDQSWKWPQMGAFFPHQPRFSDGIKVLNIYVYCVYTNDALKNHHCRHHFQWLQSWSLCPQCWCCTAANCFFHLCSHVK